MANVSGGDSPSLHIVLERIDPDREIARYYVLSIETDAVCEAYLDPALGPPRLLKSATLQLFPG
jgi:hypothetical protein